MTALRVLAGLVAFVAAVGLTYGIMEGSWIAVGCSAFALLLIASIVLTGDA